MIGKETVAIYCAGLIQGIVLVAFPAVGTILTNPDAFNFSSTAYGGLFIPQAIISIAASALNPKLSRHFGSKSVFMIGLIANLISMALLASSVLVMKNGSYLMLICATGCLGLGFGLLVPTLNEMAALLYPAKVNSALLVLNALLGVGTALAPVFISLFVAFGFWWGLPLLLVVLLISLLLFSWPLALPDRKTISSIPKLINFPKRFWFFAASALLYGIIETLNGNWVLIYMSKHLHASLEMQSIALTAFWGMATFGRVFFAAIERFFRAELAFQILPFITAAAFIIIASLSTHAEYTAIAAFGLTGFGCSALLPLMISFGSKQLSSMAASVPGLIIAFYLLGYGVAAFGVGPLEGVANLSMSTIFGFGAVIAALLGGTAILIVNSCKS